MKLNRFIAILILFFCIIKANAQDETHIVKYKYSDRTDFPRVNSEFFIKDIVDARDDTTSIGVVQKGMFNKKTKANFANGAKAYFLNLAYDTKYFIDFGQNKLPVYIQLKDLNISEWTSATSEKGMVDLNLNFYSKSDDNTLNLIFQTEIYLETGGMDVTGSHYYRINEAFLKSLSKFNEYLLKGKTAQIGGASNTEVLPIYSDYTANIEQFLKNENIDKINYNTEETSEDNLLKTTKIRPGVFVSFKDLIKNRPIFNQNYEVEYYDARARVKLRTQRKNKVIKQKFWAVSDGENLYINSKLYNPMSNFYTKVMHFGTLLIWKDNIYDANDAAIQAGFGILGLIVSDAVKKGDCMFLDTRTGVLNHANPSTLNQLLKDNPTLLDEYQRLDHRRNAESLIQLLVTYNKELGTSK